MPGWILLHAGLMLTAWTLLLPLGVLAARFFKVTAGQGYPAVLDNPLWWNLHRCLQYAGVLCSTAGLLIAWNALGTLKLDVPHALLGLGTVALGWVQVALGVFRGSKGGPTDPRGPRGDHYDMTPRRVLFEWTHRIGGYAALLLALLSAWTGLALVRAPTAAFLLLLLSPLVYAALHVLLSRQRWRVVGSYAAIWGPDEQQPGLLGRRGLGQQAGNTPGFWKLSGVAGRRWAACAVLGAVLLGAAPLLLVRLRRKNHGGGPGSS